jgi:hypothetical protein
MSNLPSGAENDPRAPWQSNNTLCRYCDSDLIYETLREEMLGFDPDCDEDCVEERIEEIISEYPLCKDCAKEEYYDYDEDEL